MAKILDGKMVSAKIKSQLKDEVATFETPVGLAVIIVGDNQASRVYVNNKKNACAELGISRSTWYKWIKEVAA